MSYHCARVQEAAEELAIKKKCEAQEPTADVRARQKERAEKAIAQLPLHTLLMCTDGGYTPYCPPDTKDHRGKPKPETAEAAGWGAVMWHRVVHAEGIDERPLKYKNRGADSARGQHELREKREKQRCVRILMRPVCALYT
jgi:hypothetical protein